MVGDLITVEEVARFEGVTERTILRQLAGQRTTTLVAKQGMGPRGRLCNLVFSGSMSLEAQKRYGAEKRAAIVKGGDSGIGTRDSGLGTRGSGLGAGEDAQIPLLPRTDEDKIIEKAILKLMPSQVAPVMARFRGIQLTLNHDFSALGRGRKTNYEDEIANELGLSTRHLLRLREKFIEVSKGEGLDAAVQSLALNSPGPKKWTGTPLDLDQDEGQSNAVKLKMIWEEEHLTRRQTYQKFVRYLETKQRGTGPSWIYAIPSEQAVIRFINLDPPWGLGGNRNPRRNGPEAVKEVAGYIDREYDEAAGDCWCTDEWEIDVYAGDRALPKRIYNWGKKGPVVHLISYIDERTTCILDWMLTIKIDRDVVVLAERMVRKYWLPLRFVADRAGRFRQLANATRIVRDSGELVEKITGPLGELGVKPRGGEEKNPRANRIERLQLEYARRAQRDFGKSWRPPKDSGMREATGIDDRAQAHLRRKHQTDPTELIWFDEIEAIVAKWIEEINNAPTEAKGCAGMTRLQAFEYFQPTPAEIALRQPTSQMIDLAFAERDKKVIHTGGIVVWSDGLRYSTPELDDNRCEKLPVMRYRRDLSQIVVDVYGRTVIAQRRNVVGTKNQKLLADEMEKKNRRRKQLARTGGEVPTLENAFERDMEDGARDTGLGIRGSRAMPAVSRIPSPESRVPSPESRVQDSAAGAHGKNDMTLSTALASALNSSNVPDVFPAIANPPQESSDEDGSEWRVASEEQELDSHPEISSMEWMARRRRLSRIPSPESRVASPESRDEEGVGFADLE